MERITLNNELNFSYPEDFHIMDEKELSGITFLQEGPGYCLRSPEKHIMIAAGYKKGGFFVSLLLDSLSMAKRMEGQVEKALSAGGYRMECPLSRRIAGKTADGFRYRYEVSGVGMTGESYILKYRKNFYFFHVYVRENLKEESLAVWNAFLDSAVPSDAVQA